MNYKPCEKAALALCVQFIEGNRRPTKGAGLVPDEGLATASLYFQTKLMKRS